MILIHKLFQNSKFEPTNANSRPLILILIIKAKHVQLIFILKKLIFFPKKLEQDLIEKPIFFKEIDKSVTQIIYSKNN